MLEEGLLGNEIEDDSRDHSDNILENQKNSEGSRYVKNEDCYYMKKDIETLGDFPVFGYYSVFFIFLCEMVMFPVMANITFMVYGGIFVL